MDRVRIADLKAHLSAYLARVRRGETLEVCDRDTPIARLSPLESDLLVVRPATRPPGDLFKLRGLVPAVEVDVVDLLRESRDER
jgi:prevent-host-death family protein